MSNAGRRKTPKRWKGKITGDDLLNPDQAVDALGGNITAQGIRKRVREGHLTRHILPQVPDLIFVKRSELMALYAHKIDKWKGVKK
jgi:hypothetical protein